MVRRVCDDIKSKKRIGDIVVKFKVGDIVRAKKREDGHEYYGITTSRVRCKVVAVDRGIDKEYMSVIVIDSPHISIQYDVRPERFRHEYNRSE